MRGVIADADRFDAAFFGVPAREALLMDPQQRVFLELCWNALEDAGIDPARAGGPVGVYAGSSNNSYRRLVRITSYNVCYTKLLRFRACSRRRPACSC